MEDLDRILDDFTNPATGSLHGAVFLAVDKSGNLVYEKTSGRASVDPDGAKPMQIDLLYWVASITKLATAVAVVQLIERGLLSLDDDIREKLPELKDIQIIHNMKYDTDKGSMQPEFYPVQGRLTLAHLMCHTSGFVYDSLSPLLQQWSKSRGRTAYTFSGSMDGYRHPLLFQPGTSWGYGAGLDWAGRLIEHVTGCTLEEYMYTNIWSRIGATSTTFHPEHRPESLPPLLEMGIRMTVGQGAESVSPGSIIYGQPAEDDLGGIGLFSTPMDMIKLLSALLQGGGPLLSNKSVDLLFRPQLNDMTRTAMPERLGRQTRRIVGIRTVEDITQADYCPAGTITLKDIPGRRRRGTVSWSGLPNLHWWIDRQTGVAAILCTQLMPPGDPAVADLTIELEKALYRMIASQQPGYLSGGMKL